MTEFEVKRNDDGSFVLLNMDGNWIDGKIIKDNPTEPICVWATARTAASGQAFYVKLPVTRELIKHDPACVEDRLRMFAERWAEQHEREAR